ncbi:hypothetical protein LJR039_007356 [Pseudorhodoferax sp. LjRoot39]|uniref:hypothetical protein n=1 Tax=Pseudorhodoferax sp. LjRoot39 TaxID=3342328 RepID=UPI003ECD5593
MLFTIDKPLPPPTGYSSWLDYAVERFDTRDPWLDSLFANMFDPSVAELDRAEIRESARIELRALRNAATGC